MSIMQEYERIRKDLGEERFARIETFLAAHPDLYLSDVYYKEEVFKQFEEEEKKMIMLGEVLDLSGAFYAYDKALPGDLWDEDVTDRYYADKNDKTTSVEAHEYVMDVAAGYKLVAHEIFTVGRDEDGEPLNTGETVARRFFLEGKEGRREELSKKEIKEEEASIYAHPRINEAPSKGFRFEKSENLKDDIMKRLEEGIKPLFETERYKEYLKTAAKFHSYSFNNQLLIWLQCPEATRVAGFNKWKELGRAVNKGEKGLKIIACGEKKNKEKDDAGNEKEFIQRYFFPATVFDVSQTSGKDIVLSPFDDHRLDGTFERFEQCRDALIHVAGCPVIFDAISGGADGYWNRQTNEIHIKDSISQQATISTLVHEITHSRLHTDVKELKDRGAGRSTWEVEAESVSFIVCEQLGLDTSSESFGYIAGWSKDKDLPELKKSLELITKEAQKLNGDILDVLEGKNIHQSKEKATCQKR